MVGVRVVVEAVAAELVEAAAGPVEGTDWVVVGDIVEVRVGVAAELVGAVEGIAEASGDIAEVAVGIAEVAGSTVEVGVDADWLESIDQCASHMQC